MISTMKPLATVAALLLAGSVFAQSGPPPGPEGPPPAAHDMSGPHAHGGMRGMGPGGLRLAPMSPRLAGYFGAKSGVLVLSAGNPALKLEDGDVVTAIGGRTPDSPMHAMRILHSYQPGEKVSLQVLRDRKSVSIEVTLPEHHGGMHGPGSRMERQDAPPAPTPAAPAPTHQH